jgi:hypothetical protein
MSEQQKTSFDTSLLKIVIITGAALVAVATPVLLLV